MTTLPAAFADLEPHAPTWALPTENLRSARRWRSTPAEFKLFYDAMLPRIDAVLTHLDQFSLGALPDAEQRLLHLALAFSEVAPHIELYKGSPEVPNSFEASRFAATHGDVVNG